jgi:hypothetical protein
MNASCSSNLFFQQKVLGLNLRSSYITELLYAFYPDYRFSLPGKYAKTRKVIPM